MTVIVVRHAHAGDRAGWLADDRRRPLSEHGHRQAKALVEVLADHPIDRILTSHYDRCVQTVLPLADARGLQVEPHPDLAEESPRLLVRELLWSCADQDVVWCSHGDVIGDLIGDLRMMGVDLPEDPPRWQKASAWALEVADHRVLSAAYLPPPA